MKAHTGRPSGNGLQAVVFDWAGTIVDCGCQGPLRILMESFAAFGVEVTLAETREPMGVGKRAHVDAMCAMPRIAELWLARYGRRPSIQDREAVYRLAEESMLAGIHRYSAPIYGAVEAVEEMRRWGLSIGSCTGYPRVVGELVANRAKDFGYVPDVLVCSDEVQHGRPAPDMCKEVLARLGVADPARAVKIGDTVNDVLEGVRAGMWVIGITLSGALAGLSEDELEAVPIEDKEALHHQISHKLLLAGAHFTAPDVPSCLSLCKEIEKRC